MRKSFRAGLPFCNAHLLWIDSDGARFHDPGPVRRNGGKPLPGYWSGGSEGRLPQVEEVVTEGQTSPALDGSEVSAFRTSTRNKVEEQSLEEATKAALFGTFRGNYPKVLKLEG